MSGKLSRRQLLGTAVGAFTVGAAAEKPGVRAVGGEPAQQAGCVVGHPVAAEVGQRVLESGGNAVDAAVAAALAVAVAAPHQTGIGGYGGHMVLAFPRKDKVIAIDYNSAAPSAARPDMFAPDAVKARANLHGWRAVGVPGVLAGLQLALDQFGSRPLRELVQPALTFARDGVPIDAGLASAIRSARAGLQKDPASAALYLAGGELPKSGDRFRNPDLARLLEELARHNSVEPFYRGDIAHKIAAAMKKSGGMVTADDLKSYSAHKVEPLRLDWRGYAIHTAPLSAGGLTVLQALATMRELGPEYLDSKRAFARLEALRLAWHDRLTLLGDPAHTDVPVARLLSAVHAKQSAQRVAAAVRAGKPAPSLSDGRSAGGTIHLSAADRNGNMVALTLTHGEAFGAQVTVEGLGLTLGHGMSRFEPRPGHPNSPGAGKRPLHNMCPTIVLKDARPLLALGGRGGRKIPNSVFEVLLQFVGRGASLDEALAAGRAHTEGDLKVGLDPKCSDTEVEQLKKVGYSVQRAPSAYVSAIALDTKTDALHGASR